MFETDVFVIGGGPAGLAAALAARQKGMRVVVADGNSPPVDKPCGEGLLPDSRRSAARIGVELPASLGFEFRGVRFAGTERSVAADFPDGAGIGIRRTVLHGALIEAAVRAGVELRWDTPVTDLYSIDARWIVGADGQTSRVRLLAGLDGEVYSSHRFARRRHFAIAPWSEYMEIHWSDGCQLYVTPVGPDEVCLALISADPELRLAEALEHCFPALNERIAGAPETSRERGSITATVKLREVARGNIALVGDASGSVDAITGEGICLCFRQAAALADAMTRDDLSIYDRAHPGIAFRPRVMAKAMLTLDRGGPMQQFALGAMSAQPWIFEKLLAFHVA